MALSLLSPRGVSSLPSSFPAALNPSLPDESGEGGGGHLAAAAVPASAASAASVPVSQSPGMRPREPRARGDVVFKTSAFVPLAVASVTPGSRRWQRRAQTIAEEEAPPRRDPCCWVPRQRAVGKVLSATGRAALFFCCPGNTFFPYSSSFYKSRYPFLFVCFFDCSLLSPFLKNINSVLFPSTVYLSETKGP